VLVFAATAVNSSAFKTLILGSANVPKTSLGLWVIVDLVFEIARQRQ
jgi:hypothetical protein